MGYTRSLSVLSCRKADYSWSSVYNLQSDLLGVLRRSLWILELGVETIRMIMTSNRSRTIMVESIDEIISRKGAAECWYCWYAQLSMAGARQRWFDSCCLATCDDGAVVISPHINSWWCWNWKIIVSTTLFRINECMITLQLWDVLRFIFSNFKLSHELATRGLNVTKGRWRFTLDEITISKLWLSARGGNFPIPLYFSLVKTAKSFRL